MPFLGSKYAKITYGPSSAPDPAEGAYSVPETPIAGLTGPTSKRREGKVAPPFANSWIRP